MIDFELELENSSLEDLDHEIKKTLKNLIRISLFTRIL